MNQKTNEVYITSNYGKFKTLKGNRALNNTNLKRIMLSMKTKRLFAPVIVNENMEIIDGNHRFNACRQLELPIEFIICEGYSLPEVQVLNANSKNWGNMDYLKSFIELDYPEYKKVGKFMRDYPNFTIAVAMCLTGLSSRAGFTQKGDHKHNDFRNGDFSCSNIAKTYEIADELVKLKSITDLYNRRIFAVAYMKVFKHKNFNKLTFLKKMTSNRRRIEPCANSDQYIDLFQEIYNYRNRDKVSLKY